VRRTRLSAAVSCARLILFGLPPYEVMKALLE
jgi:hypothetical protein